MTLCSPALFLAWVCAVKVNISRQSEPSVTHCSGRREISFSLWKWHAGLQSPGAAQGFGKYPSVWGSVCASVWLCVTSCVYYNSTHSWVLQGGDICGKVIGSATEMSASPDELFPKFKKIFRQKQGTTESLAVTQVNWWQPWWGCLHNIKTLVSVFQTEEIIQKSRFNNVQVSA